MNSTASVVIIAVGDELVRGFILDTNSRWLAQEFRAVGWPVRRAEMIADDTDAIAASITRAQAEDHVTRILVCGGMGPTPDDRTVEAVASALGRPTVTSDAVVERITAMVGRMHEAGRLDSPIVSEANLRMTRIPEGATVLENRLGMAPSLALTVGEDRWLFVLPGIPHEMQAIVAEELIPRYFSGRVAGTVVELRYSGTPEAIFSPAMWTVEAEFPGVSIGSYPQTASRELIIRLEGDDGAAVAAAGERFRVLSPAAPQPARGR